MITNTQIKKVTDIIVEEIQPEKVLLFGSYASGIPNKYSDIDIIVLINRELRKKTELKL
jgi:predicted nucleotidyltransferase